MMNNKLLYKDVFKDIDHIIHEKKDIIIVIDGKSGSGKSTLAYDLQQHYQASLFHMDDFFLQIYQRTPERFNEAGGNVDYERFYQSVILPLLGHNDVNYQRFDCSTMTLGKVQTIPYHHINIIEGTYSLHPYFQDYYDNAIVLDVSADLQKKRIIKREGLEKWKTFEKRWIPLENYYFQTYDIYQQAHFILEYEK